MQRGGSGQRKSWRQAVGLLSWLCAGWFFVAWWICSGRSRVGSVVGACDLSAWGNAGDMAMELRLLADDRSLSHEQGIAALASVGT